MGGLAASLAAFFCSGLVNPSTTDVIAGAIATRLGRSPDDFAARNIAGAIIGVVMTSSMPWDEMTAASADYVYDRIDAGLAHLEAGLPL